MGETTMDSKKALAFLGAIILVATALSAQGWRAVLNRQQHYSVTIPSNWTIWHNSPNGTIAATTYSRSHALEGGLVPAEEAEITIFPHNGATEPMKAWIASSLRYSEELQRKDVDLQMGKHADVSSYVEVDSRYDAGPNIYYCRVTAYYSLHGQLFAAQLEFRQGAKDELEYRSVLNQIVRSVTQVSTK